MQMPVGRGGQAGNRNEGMLGGDQGQELSTCHTERGHRTPQDTHSHRPSGLKAEAGVTSALPRDPCPGDVIQPKRSSVHLANTQSVNQTTMKIQVHV